MVPITLLYASILGLLLIALSLGVIRERLQHRVSLGDGGVAELQRAGRRHGNFIEYVPFALLLVALVELNGTSAWVVHALGATLVVGRVLHPLGLEAEFGVRVPRVLGTVATLGVIAAASVVGILGAG